MFYDNYFIYIYILDFFGRKRSILFGAAIFGFGSLFAVIIIFIKF